MVHQLGHRVHRVLPDDHQYFIINYLWNNISERAYIILTTYIPRFGRCSG